MQRVDDETNAEENRQKLPQDYAKPFSPAEDVTEKISEQDQRTDIDLDEQEAYDAGKTAAAGRDLPSGPVNDTKESGAKL